VSERNAIGLAEALLENTNVTYLRLETERYTKSSAEAMVKSTCVPVSACSEFVASEIRVENCSSEMKCFVVFYLNFKRVRHSRNYTWNCLLLEGRPIWRSKCVGVYPELTVSESSLSSWSTIVEYMGCGCSPVWIEKERHSTRAHTGICGGGQRQFLPFRPVCVTILSFKGSVCMGMRWI
jgi:pyruvate formate-lyase activating enzyme-like uncharacterized protein